MAADECVAALLIIGDDHRMVGRVEDAIHGSVAARAMLTTPTGRSQFTVARYSSEGLVIHPALPRVPSGESFYICGGSLDYDQSAPGGSDHDSPLSMNADEATAVDGQLSTLDKLGSALMKQLMKVVDEGVGPVTGSRHYADARLAHFGDPEKAIKRIVAETTASSALAGFATGLGGLITLPVTLPANITGQAILNARMVGAIAHLRGWDLQDELVRNSVLITVAGGTPNAVLAEFGVTVAQKSAEAAIKRLPNAIVREINKRVGFMLIAKYGTKRSVLTLSKLVPGVGGVVGGAVDATFTRLVGRLARKSFPALAPAVDATAANMPSGRQPAALVHNDGLEGIRMGHAQS